MQILSTRCIFVYDESDIKVLRLAGTGVVIDANNADIGSAITAITSTAKYWIRCPCAYMAILVSREPNTSLAPNIVKYSHNFRG